MEVIAEVEDLEHTLRRFPGLTRDQLGAILLKKQMPLPFEEPPPPKKSGKPGALLAWTDGASRGNPGPAAVGAVLRDVKGNLVAEVARAIGTRTNNFAEYAAVMAALETARELGAAEVLLHADSELVVRQLSGVYRVKNADLRPLYEAVKTLERSFARGVRYKHVPREQNKDADALANQALDELA